MRPAESADGEREEKSLFERWMGMTADEWDALGAPDEEPRNAPLLPLHEQ